jgi:hypothetical protein
MGAERAFDDAIDLGRWQARFIWDETAGWECMANFRRVVGKNLPGPSIFGKDYF